MLDFFRPSRQPAKMLYDAFQEEAANRFGRNTQEWMTAERIAVWAAARDYAQQHGLRVLTLAEIQKAEESARGHIDYGAKWAYGVASMLTTKTPNEKKGESSNDPPARDEPRADKAKED